MYAQLQIKSKLHLCARQTQELSHSNQFPTQLTVQAKSCSQDPLPCSQPRMTSNYVAQYLQATFVAINF